MNGTRPRENTPNTSPMYRAFATVVLPVGEQELAQRRAEHREEDRRRAPR